MEKFISCDWGTTSFRLRVADAHDLSLLATHTSDQGIADTHRLWETYFAEQRPADRSQGRLAFYRSFIADGIARLEQALNTSMEGLPVMLSGMASSSLGMMELPYREFPFSMDGSDLRAEKIPASAVFGHDLLLISGARTSDDVMRGEETQLVGCDPGPGDEGEDEQVFVFPGTHAKHVLVRHQRAIGLKTYMTGEFFNLLSNHSILTSDISVKGSPMVPGQTVSEASDPMPSGVEGSKLACFECGVLDGAGKNLLHSAFRVRINHLLKGVSKTENYFYLSGLLIGAELGELAMQGSPVTLVCTGSLKDYYLAACRALGIDGVRIHDATQAVLQGQRRIAKARGFSI